MTTMMMVAHSSPCTRVTNDRTNHPNVYYPHSVPSLSTKMSFSDESIRKLADIKGREVFDVLSTDGRFLDGVMNSMEPAIEDVMGRISPELVGDLGCEIMNRIGFIEENGPYSHNNIWKTRYEALYNYVKTNYAESYVDGSEYGIMDNQYDGEIG